MSQDSIIFEQPTTELTRVCLRLEYLFQSIDEAINKDSHFDRQFTMQQLIEIVRILDRPDLKSKLTQELHRLLTLFKRFTNQADIDTSLLQSQISGIEKNIHYLSSISGKLGKTLIENEFLSNIRLNLNTAGNGCCIDMPAYYYWLHDNAETQLKDLRRWLEELIDIKKIVYLLLSIIRGANQSKLTLAENGFYHQNLQTTPVCQLLRIKIPSSLNLFPEISAGKHRFTVRFLEANIEKPTQSEKNIEFELTVCAI